MLPWKAPGIWRAGVRRFAEFWIVWSVLLCIHEAGHAILAHRQGLEVRKVTVGVGPVIREGHVGGTGFALRLLPVAGLTTLRGHGDAGRRAELVALSGGVAATVALTLGLVTIAAASERLRRRRCLWARILIADAVVLSVFNLLPVPPLDGGRAVFLAVDAIRGAPLPSDALFWVHLGGFALAVLPMMLWPRWTRIIDRTALWWRAPRVTGPDSSDTAGTRTPA